MKADIWDFINYNPKVGTEAAYFVGLPGSGKSNSAHWTFIACIGKGECGIVHGDPFAEWRHYYNYPDEIQDIRILIPEKYEHLIDMSDMPSITQKDIKRVNFQTLDITKHLKPHRVVVVYDSLFEIGSQAWLWVKLFKQIVLRQTNKWIPVTYLNHEAGVMWCEDALAEDKLGLNHWRAVHAFCRLFVSFRKAFVRPIFVAQSYTEIKHQLRKKSMFHIFKQGEGPRNGWPQLRAASAALARDKYNIQVGGPWGLYDRYIPTEKILEAKDRALMKPMDEITLADGKEYIAWAICLDCGEDWQPIKDTTKRCQFCQKNPGNIKIIKISATTTRGS